MTTMFWIWMAAALIFLIIELTTPTLIFLSFVVAAAAAGIYSYFEPTEYYWQLGIFAALSLILIPTTRRFAKRITKEAPEHANVDRMLGGIAIVTKDIDPDVGGQVKYEGELWVAKADEPIAANNKVKIISVAGTRVHVQKVS